MAEQQTNTEVAHEGGAHAPFPPFQGDTFASQFLWLVLTFGALYILMSRVALPRVGQVLEMRKDTIARQLADAANMQARANEASVAHEKSLADARASARALAQQARDKLTAESDAKRREIEAELSAKLAAAEARVAETTAQAMTNVESIARETAGVIIEHLTGKSAAPDEIARAFAAAKA